MFLFCNTNICMTTGSERITCSGFSLKQTWNCIYYLIIFKMLFFFLELIGCSVTWQQQNLTHDNKQKRCTAVCNRIYLPVTSWNFLFEPPKDTLYSRLSCLSNSHLSWRSFFLSTVYARLCKMCYSLKTNLLKQAYWEIFRNLKIFLNCLEPFCFCFVFLLTK